MNKTISDGYGYMLNSASIFDIEKPEELKDVLRDIRKKNLRFKVLGGLNNVIFANQKSDIVILRLRGTFFKTIEREGQLLSVGAGAKVSVLMKFALENSIGGLEYLVGIPATVGGAVAGNSGAFGKEISDSLFKIEAFDDKGESVSLKRDEIDFEYRGSNLDNLIITRVYLKSLPKTKLEISNDMKLYMKRRISEQDLRGASCGSFFKNPTKEKAAYLIDSLGLKGRTRAGAVVSPKHANFLINLDSSSSEDILSLKDILQRRVWKERREWLMPEVKFIW